MGEAVVIILSLALSNLGSSGSASTPSPRRTGSVRRVRFPVGLQPRRGATAPERPKADSGSGGVRPRLWRGVINELAVAEEMTQKQRGITINRQLRRTRRNLKPPAKSLVRSPRAELNPDHRIHDRPHQRPGLCATLTSFPADSRVKAAAGNFMLWRAAYAEYIFQVLAL